VTQRKPPPLVIGLLAAAGPTFAALAAYTGLLNLPHFVWLAAAALLIGAVRCAELGLSKKPNT
jgi:hypothetical protein